MHQAARLRTLDIPVAVYLPGPPHPRYTADLRQADALISDGWSAKHLPTVLGAPVDDVLKGVDTALFTPDGANLRWRGFSRFAPLPESQPLTPDYDKLLPAPPWRRTPSGWCTRYGPVNELLRERDDALVLLNGGDELALTFRADRLPPKPPGFTRDFFLRVVGWDKDADFHVGQGWRVEPLPFRGMDDQAYGHEIRPPVLNDAWIKKYNTRWVGPMVLTGR